MRGHIAAVMMAVVMVGCSSKYRVEHLVHYEAFDDIREAIKREKALKEWRRDWKIALIERGNPEWLDLHDGFAGCC